MHKKQTLAITTLSLPLTLALAQGYTRPAYADDISLGVYPTVTEITAHSGETLETRVTVKNLSNSSASVTTLLQPFTSGSDGSGQVRYTDDQPDIFSTIQVFSERQHVNEVEIAPHEEKPLTLRISIPEDQTPRDYYFSLVLLSKPVPQTETGEPGIQAHSSISAGVASHFLISVNKQSNQELSLTEFSTAPLHTASPIPFRLRIANDGPNFSQAQGTIIVDNIFGMAAQKIIVPETTVLSQSTRNLGEVSNTNQNAPAGNQVPDAANEPTIQETAPLFPGIYRARLSIQEEGTKTPFTKTIYFAVAPYELVTALMVIVILLFLIRKRIQTRIAEHMR